MGGPLGVASEFTRRARGTLLSRATSLPARVQRRVRRAVGTRGSLWQADVFSSRFSLLAAEVVPYPFDVIVKLGGKFMTNGSNFVGW